MQIGLMRDYMDMEFESLCTWPFPYDRERLIDDFVLLCMLVGNDFLPPLPTLDIAEGAPPPLKSACRNPCLTPR